MKILAVATLALGLVAGSTAQSLDSIISGSSWYAHGGDRQHTNVSPFSAQAMRGVLWSTPVDLAPQYSGSSLLMHYASPLATASNTIILAVKTGSYDGFKFEGRDAGDGSLIWTENTAYSLPPNNWTPTCEGVITPDNSFYFPGPGGTVYKRASADDATSTVTQLCFYGLAEYSAFQATYDANIKICTPIVSDSSGNIFFGFRALGATNLNLPSGIARISSAGVGTYVSGGTLSNDASATMPGLSCAPCFSNDENTLYVGIRGASSALGYLCAFDADTLARVNSVRLLVPETTTAAYLLDDSTASPTVGPDGDVYYGAWYSNGYRGFLLHYNADLSVTKTPGAFGWDITPSIVPASMVPSYSGSSSYLILIKYNKYIEGGFGGQNEVAVLDPNDTMTDPVSGKTTMKEVWVKLAPTPDPRGGFIEWCVNTTAVDPSTKSAIVNSEDGKCYRWDLVTNTFTESVTLTAGLGEAYTSTIIGPDGLCYAMSNATVFALWDMVVPASVSFNRQFVVGGDQVTGTVTLSDNATGPGARIYLTSNQPGATVPTYVDVPAGSDSATFPITTTVVTATSPVTITAGRYGNTSTGVFKQLGRPKFEDLTVVLTTLVGGFAADANIKLSGPAPDSGTTVALSSNTNKLMPPTTVVVPAGKANKAFKIRTNPVVTTTLGTVSATLDSITKTINFTLTVGGLSAITVPTTTIQGGTNIVGVVKLTGNAPVGGTVVTLKSNDPSVIVNPTVTVPAGSKQANILIQTNPVGANTPAKVNAILGNTTRAVNLTITP